MLLYSQVKITDTTVWYGRNYQNGYNVKGNLKWLNVFVKNEINELLSKEIRFSLNVKIKNLFYCVSNPV